MDKRKILMATIAIFSIMAPLLADAYTSSRSRTSTRSSISTTKRSSTSTRSSIKTRSSTPVKSSVTTASNKNKNATKTNNKNNNTTATTIIRNESRAGGSPFISSLGGSFVGSIAGNMVYDALTSDQSLGNVVNDGAKEFQEIVNGSGEVVGYKPLPEQSQSNEQSNSWLWAILFLASPLLLLYLLTK